jgi:hypothetical protein
MNPGLALTPDFAPLIRTTIYGRQYTNAMALPVPASER